MKNRAVRAALFLLVVLALAGSGYEVARLERQAAAARAAARAFEAQARQVEAALLELRSAQFAYVAPGQGSAFWTSRTAALLSALGKQLRELAELEKSAVAAGVRSDGPKCAPALDELATLQRLDAGVQGYLRENQALLASDLVFNDLREAGLVIASRLQEARRQMAAAEQEADDQVKRRQAATAGGAAVFALLVLALLLPAGARGKPSSQAVSLEAVEDAVADAEARRPEEPRRMIPRAPAVGGLPGATARSDRRPWPEAGENPVAAPSSAASADLGRRSAIDLPAAAALCSDFARVHESTQLPALLERLAGLLDAAGVVIWVHDPAHEALRPALSSGYAAPALARIHAIPASDESVTACAYREQKLRIVEGDGKGNGAIAAPLVGTDGCVGVMAVEIRGGIEREPDVQAIATIVAAQLATFVAPAEQAAS